MITDMKDAKIFQPLQLGRTTLKNRIAMAPMSMHYEATNGTVPKQLADIFVRRAEGGAGYVVIDAVTVDHKYWYIGKYATHLMEQGLNIGILERLLLLIRTLWFLSSRDSQLV